MLHLAGVEQTLQLVIHAKLVGHLRFMLRHAGDGVVVDRRVYVINQIFIVFITVGEAQVLGKRQRIAEVMLEAVADRRLFAPRLVEAGFADVEVVRHVARAGREQRAGTRQEVTRSGFRIVLVAGQQRKAGIFVRQPGEGRGDGHPLLLAVFDKLMFGSGDTVQAIEQGVVVIELAAKIKRRFRQMAVAGAEFHLVNALGGRALAGHHHHAAGADLAVQHAGRAVHHLHALQQPGIDLPGAAILAREAKVQAVEQLGRITEAAADHFVIAVGVAAVGGDHPAGVVQCVGDRRRLLVVHLLARDHRDGLRRLTQSGGGLGASGALFSDDPFGRCGHAVLCVGGHQNRLVRCGGRVWREGQ